MIYATHLVRVYEYEAQLLFLRYIQFIHVSRFKTLTSVALDFCVIFVLYSIQSGAPYKQLFNHWIYMDTGIISMSEIVIRIV